MGKKALEFVKKKKKSRNGINMVEILFLTPFLECMDHFPECMVGGEW